MNSKLKMSKQRYAALVTDVTLALTEEELKDGWHFCPEWDGMLIHPTMAEAECCLCSDIDKQDIHHEQL